MAPEGGQRRKICIYMLLTICGVLSDTLFLFCSFAELAQIKSTPTDSELAVQIDETESKVRVRIQPCPLFWACIITQQPNASSISIYAYAFLFVFSIQVAKLREHLEPLRAGTPLVSTAELNALDAEWIKWRSEWVRRRKVFYKCAPLVFSLHLASPTGRPHAPTDIILFI